MVNNGYNDEEVSEDEGVSEEGVVEEEDEEETSFVGGQRRMTLVSNWGPDCSGV